MWLGPFEADFLLLSDNFAYRNPNYNLPSSSSESASVAEGTISGEEELNLVDTHYVSLETLSEADANRLKSRSKYAQLGVSDMGVPTSPIDSSPERLPHLRYPREGSFLPPSEQQLIPSLFNFQLSLN